MHLLFQGVPIALVFSTLCAIIVKSVPHGGGHEPIYDPSSQNNEQNSNTGVGLIGSSHIDTMPLIAGTQNMDIRMPGAAPTRNDHYMCTAKKLPNQKIYLVGFEALSSASIAHHILLFGCDVPASNDEIWDCGLVCGGTNQRIIFAWAKNADPIHMPIDVGFEVGPQIKTSYLVMQIHYKHPHKAGEPLDTSGLRLSATTESQMYLAGIYLLLGMESVPADKQIFNVDVSCPYNGEAKLYPFAFRTHAHDLARVVSGYKYNGTWTELARGNPQWPQAFYPVTHNLSVSNGEYLFSRCSYNSSQRHRTTYMGSTGSDEMCNLYIMYYTDATRGKSYYSCGHKNQLDNIPVDADVMLPPNPLLDEAAKGEGHHHSHGMGGSGGQEASQNPPTRPPTQHPTQDPRQYNVQYADLESQNDAIVDFRMPGANPTRHDHYMCTAMKVPKGTSYLVAFEAIATAKIAHHILLFGCEVPANRAPIWDCGMVCGTRKQRVVFAWAKNAPPFEVPKDVGFKVGTDEHTDYLVMQIHYVHKHADGTPLDISGLKIHFTRERQKFIAGIYLLMSGESIPGDTPTYNTDVSCRYAGPTQIFPFAFRTHAHDLGKVVSGYKYNGTWYELARGNPQWPQSFYAVSHKLTINPGDYLFARCTYNSSNRHRITHMGSTGEDEMCNLYLMYYTDAIRGKSYGLCTARNTLANIPAGSDTTLPPNSVLDSVASGHASMGGGHSDHVQAGLMVDLNWPRDNATIGQVGGLSTDLAGNVHIFHRHDVVWDYDSFSKDNIYQKQNRPIKVDPVVVMSNAGQLVGTWGKNRFYVPHGITVDKTGAVWLTDVALHQVFRFPASSKTPDLVLGERFVPGKDHTHFCMPSDVAVMSNGDFFVSDGYCNSRVMKFSNNGTFITEWGTSSWDAPKQSDGYPPTGTFSLVHSITVAEDKGVVCVADRENGRIQCFDFDGNFNKQIHHPEFGEKLFAIAYCKAHGGVIFAVNGPNLFNTHDVEVQGFTVNVDSGQIVGKWKPSPSALTNPHDVAVDTERHTVYVGEIGPNVVWKFVLAGTKQHLEPTKKGRIPSYKWNPPAKYPSMASPPHEVGAEPEPDGKASMIIGILLVVPIMLLIMIAIFVRLYTTGKLNCCAAQTQKSRVFNLGKFSYFKSHKGFDKLSTEESDHETDPLNDGSSEEEEEFSKSRKA